MSQKGLPKSVEGYPDDFGWKFTKTYHYKSEGDTDPAKVSLPKPFVVSIIGSRKGIGASIAKAYALAGASGIALSSRTLADLKEVEAENLQMNSKTNVLCQEADIANEASLITLAAKVKATFGRLDVAVINAGTLPKLLIGADGTKRFLIGTLEDSTADFMRVWNINFTGIFAVAAGDQRWSPGSGVHSSASSHWISTDFSPFAYNLSKFALNRLVEIIHDSHHKDGIVAYALHPGAIQTPLVKDYPEEWSAVLQDDITLPGGFCVWLTREKREWLSGRYVSSNWDTKELEAQKEGIINGDKLKYKMVV